MLQKGILYAVFSQKCSAAWQGAREERLTVGIMLPGRQDADDWLNFMLSQKNLWPTFTIQDLSGVRGAVCFTLSHLVCKFSWQICLAWCLGLCVGVACFWFACVLCWFLSSREI